MLARHAHGERSVDVIHLASAVMLRRAHNDESISQWLQPPSNRERTQQQDAHRLLSRTTSASACMAGTVNGI